MTSIPAFVPGNVIQVRRRLWRVDARHGDVLTATAIDGQTDQIQFYIPFEDIHPGELPLPSSEQVGTWQAQQLLLRAYRLSMLHGTAPLLSLQRSRVIPKDYQLVPVVMSLEMPRVRLLLADDVGLGKTIEAGLILTELLVRQLARRILIIVPANLREQWREALDYFFHISPRIISTRHRREMERELPAGTNPWEAYPVLITSVDYAKQPAIKNQILEVAWDAVLVDEAHQVARPHLSSPDQRAKMDRHELVDLLAPNVRHLLLLTATPHNGYSDSFASLLDLLKVDAVDGPAHDPIISREIARRHVCQRRRQDVEEWFAETPDRSPFPQRDQGEVIVSPSAYEMDAIRAVEAYGERVLQQAAAGPARYRTLAHWTVLHLHKRALSSPEALRRSLKNRRAGLQSRLAEQLAEASVTVDVARANALDEDTGERLDEEEAGFRVERTAFGQAETLKAELAELEQVLALAEKVTARRDGKLQKLLDTVLTGRLRQQPKVVVFTRYLDTLDYLADQIGKDNRYADTEVLTIHGGLNERQRRDVFSAFDRAKKAVLVATDAISEGINLQHVCAQVIHYELPWNPNRLEQRNGRVDRFGQREKTVYIRTMVMDETLDATILKVLVEKAEQIRRDYGFSPPYFGDETNIIDLIQQHAITLTPKQLTLFDAFDSLTATPQPLTPADPFAPETLRRIQDESFYGQTEVSLPEVEQRLRQTAETIGSPAEVEKFVLSGLNRFGCRVEERGADRYRIAVTHPALQVASVGTVLEQATFNAEAALDDPTLTALDLGHPLVRRLLELVKQEAFTGREHYGRTAYVVTPAVGEPTALFHLLARYVVNTTPTAIIEELVPVAVPVFGNEALAAEATRRVLHPQLSAGTRTQLEVQEALADALLNEQLPACFNRAVDARRQALITERESLLARLHARPGAHEAEWLTGLADLSPGTFDVLTMTILFPE
ncbi:MAG: RNA polymerase-associated protein RapA [Anaerolineae bacterium]|nr:RNA polymerase-associated protein RapA [Anaerolineae bacterium]